MPLSEESSLNHHKEKKPIWKKVLLSIFVKGNNFLLAIFVSFFIFFLILAFSYLGMRDDAPGELYREAISTPKDTALSEAEQQAKINASFAGLQESDYEKRMQQLELDRQKKAEENLRRKREADKLQDSLQESGSAHIDVEHFDKEEIKHLINGESIFEIAKRYNVKPATLREINFLGNEDPVDGNTLTIPIRSLHQVVTGENLNKIARAYHVDKELIKKANEMSGESVNIGEVLIIPRPDAH